MRKMQERDFGRIKSGEESKLYILTNDKGMSIAVSDFGATLVRVIIPDRDGYPVDVVLGYDHAEEYENGGVFFGASIGRNANRIGGASVMIDGVKYDLEKNDGKNNLHSGNDFYNKRIWRTRYKGNQKVKFALRSGDNDQGYPGMLDMEVTYELTEENEVRISYHCSPNKNTIINMTNHSYFNLNGHAMGNILKHVVAINADAFTRADSQSIPTGEIVPVKGTPMDFRKKKTVGRDIDAEYEALIFGGGYDHNWVLNQSGRFRKAAIAIGDQTGIRMEVYTDLPGMQFYTANFVENEPGKDGAVYQKRDAMCFETQYFPDAVHHDNFQQPIYKAGEIYQTSTMYKFIVK
ncbi:MAG: galactose mutarotase [Hespellia sp.]|nr:galactose mutarotase [Hespellia sp.]